ncbi:hypothetical protein [Bifidobacterium leontopitheci]|uniref:DUF4825 domain-containing protein n=1 Tax=Bifidobacterium leontopitheci TaxID=2650774 RepID=A0A6I1GT33_9BIFI|nr:hypothetical protein [Bifidobacterium leontopitheci]KAB7791338.1 hypothetical protein F7D09_0013 [Bifidobacterium leontopitheci]
MGRSNHRGLRSACALAAVFALTLPFAGCQGETSANQPKASADPAETAYSEFTVKSLKRYLDKEKFDTGDATKVQEYGVASGKAGLTIPIKHAGKRTNSYDVEYMCRADKAGFPFSIWLTKDGTGRRMVKHDGCSADVQSVSLAISDFPDADSIMISNSGNDLVVAAYEIQGQED